jgi:hypothetical protein
MRKNGLITLCKVLYTTLLVCAALATVLGYLGVTPDRLAGISQRAMVAPAPALACALLAGLGGYALGKRRVMPGAPEEPLPRCEAGVLEVRQALWGADTRIEDRTDLARGAIRGNQLGLLARTGPWGDPAPGQAKTLSIEFGFRNEGIFWVELPEPSTVHLRMERGEMR